MMYTFRWSLGIASICIIPIICEGGQGNDDLLPGGKGGFLFQDFRFSVHMIPLFMKFVSYGSLLIDITAIVLISYLDASAQRTMQIVTLS